MAYYNLSNPLRLEQFKARVKMLIERKSAVELVERKPIRSNQQNRYLHLILGYMACETGCTLDYVKLNYFKLACNRDLFVVETNDELLGKTRVIRSTSELDTVEMTTAIERYRNWASANGYYIPAPNEDEYLRQLEEDVECYKPYLHG